MTDQETWDNAVAAVRSDFVALPGSVIEELTLLADSIRREKNSLHVLTAKKGAETLCAECGGLCCQRGKYHFTVVDLLVYLVAGSELFTPSFDSAVCPYLGKNGCLMDPFCRPFTCVTFRCERLEDQMTPEEVNEAYAAERRLREVYQRIEGLFEKRFMQGLLLNYRAYSRDTAQGMITVKGPRSPDAVSSISCRANQ